MFEIIFLVAIGYLLWKYKGKSLSKAKSWDSQEHFNSKNLTKLKVVDDIESESSNYEKIEHVKQTHLATENERKLYFALQKVLPSDYIIHSQVSLMALIKPVNFKHNSRTWAKRVDFVITDKATKVLAVIELDDSTHHWKKRQERDRYVNDVLDGHHTLIRIQTKRFYEPSEIAAILSRETEIRCNECEKAFV
ncbi:MULTISPECIES: DUF2726 domain-containing protein [Vibrio]|uniref:DUF2726 domain-containing protein n=1 Tax=Vibrio TaxID=662 RepID=UPI00053C2055|nr:DUF2726 domain-containing protein [Vibrio cholerae]EKF9771356.1 DUF2726 domain-containing protein [Vibrio cholerae]